MQNNRIENQSGLTTEAQKSYARSGEKSMYPDSSKEQSSKEPRPPRPVFNAEKTAEVIESLEKLKRDRDRLSKDDYEKKSKELMQKAKDGAAKGEIGEQTFTQVIKDLVNLGELFGSGRREEGRPEERGRKEKNPEDDILPPGLKVKRGRDGKYVYIRDDGSGEEVSKIPPEIIKATFEAQNRARYTRLHPDEKDPNKLEEAKKLTSDQEAFVAKGQLPAPMSGGSEENGGPTKELTVHDQLLQIKKRLGEQKDPDVIEAIIANEVVPHMRKLGGGKGDVPGEEGTAISSDVLHEIDTDLPEEIRQATNLDQKRILAQHLVDKVLEFFPKDRPKTERGLRETPHCLEDLAELIMEGEGKEWKTGGERQIMNEKDEVVPENFLAWVRKQMLYWHGFDSTAETDFFSKISTSGVYRVVSLNEMLYHTKYFLKRERKQEYVPLIDERTGKTLKDKDGKAIRGPDFVEHYHDDDVYNELKDQILYEAWLFNTSRNMDVKYRIPTMGSDEELPKLLGNLYAPNVFTRENHLERIFTLPTVIKKQKEEGKEKKGIFKAEANHDVGDLTRTAFLAYYFLPDVRQLREILGHDAMLFRKEYYEIEKEKASRAPKTTQKQSGISYKLLTGKGDKWNPDWYDEKGILKDDPKILSDFSKYINFFAAAMEDPVVKKEVRDRIVQSLMPKLTEQARRAYGEEYRKIAERKVVTEGRKEGKDSSNQQAEIDAEFDSMIRQRAFQEAQYAEEFAFSMMRWTLAASKNDTNGIGYDAATKITRTEQYRTRQAAEHRMGELGNMYNVPIFKSIGLDMFNAILTLPLRDNGGNLIYEGEGENKRIIKKTPIEILLEAQKASLIEDPKDREKELMKLMGQLRFLERTMSQYHADHVGRSFEVFHSITGAKEIKLEELAKIDPFRGVVFDQAKFNETVIEGFLKSMRYAYSTWRDVDFSKKVRYFVREDPATKEMIFEERPLVNILFSKEVVEGFIERFKNEKEFKRTVKQEEYNLFKEKGEISDSILKYIQFGDGGRKREHLWKEVAKLRLAAEIYSHRDLTGPYSWLTTSQVETIFAALQKIPGNLLVDPDEKDFKKTMVTKLAFDNKDIDWIRKKSRTEVGRMVGMDTADALTKGSFLGFWDAAKIFFADLTKS